MSAPAESDRPCGSATHCITCSDEGVPMRVIHAETASGVASCADGDGRRHDVLTGLVGAVVAGDLVLVHAGTALCTLESPVDGAA